MSIDMAAFWDRIGKFWPRTSPAYADTSPALSEAAGIIRHRVVGLVGAAVRRFLEVGGAERRAAVGDLARVRRLVRDAVETLQGSFNKLDETSRAQNAARGRRVPNLTSHNGADGNISIHDFVKQTETTLQYFTDLLAQISKQSIEASYKMEDMVGALDEMF